MLFEKTTIDAHIHNYTWFDKEGKNFIELHDETQKELGLKGFCLNALGAKPYGGPEQNIMAAIYKLHNPTAFANGGIVYTSYPVTNSFPEGFDPLTQYNELMEIGFDGIKILYKPNVQKEVVLPINDPSYDPFFKKAEADQTPFMWHLADPEAFWFENDGSYPSFEDMFKQAFEVLERHPSLKVTFAHFLFLSERTEELEGIFETYPNVSVDVTPGTEMYDAFTANRDFFRNFFDKYQDRILYGTDANLTEFSHSKTLMCSVYKALTTDQEVNIWGHNVKGLKLSEDVCEKVLAENFINRHGEIPKTINKVELKEYVKKYSHLISNSEDKKQILSFSEKL